MSNVHRYKMPVSVRPFYMEGMETCEIVASFFKGNFKERPPTEDEHECAWQHVKMCFACLRNVSRILFETNGGEMPLPVYAPPEKAIEMGLMDAPAPNPNAN